MNSTWEKAIAFVLEAEGGDTITETPNDPGGLTKYGISQRAYPNLDIRALSEQDAKEIYKKDYWIPCNCDGIDYPLDMCVFDCAVNHGVGTALSFLPADYRDYLLKRIDRYISITTKNPSLKAFFRGWIIRVNNLRKAVE